MEKSSAAGPPQRSVVVSSQSRHRHFTNTSQPEKVAPESGFLYVGVSNNHPEALQHAIGPRHDCALQSLAR